VNGFLAAFADWGWLWYILGFLGFMAFSIMND